MRLTSTTSPVHTLDRSFFNAPLVVAATCPVVGISTMK
jgi:hypothetical protein